MAAARKRKEPELVEPITIERVEIDDLPWLAREQAVIECMPGLAMDDRQRALARSVILRCDGRAAFAVFVREAKWPETYRAVILDIDTDGEFPELACAYMFDSMDAQKLELSSHDRDAGHRLGAAFAGHYMKGDRGYAWTLSKSDFLRR